MLLSRLSALLVDRLLCTGQAEICMFPQNLARQFLMTLRGLILVKLEGTFLKPSNEALHTWFR